MKTSTYSIAQESVFTFCEDNICKVEGLADLLARFSKRIQIGYSGFSTLKTYHRALWDISLFHGCLPDSLETDEILDYLHHLREKGSGWAKIKLEVAALKYFHREVAHDGTMASSIPYPKVAEVILKTTGKDINARTCCKEGIMRIVKIIPPPRGSPRKYPKTKQGITFMK